MSPDSVSHNSTASAGDQRLSYKALAMAFAYPDETFFRFFQIPAEDRSPIIAEYDRLFRAGRVWLEGAEHIAENEFQRVSLLADIMAFYRAFGVEPARSRPDALNCELEFMHCLEVKRARAERDMAADDAGEKAAICLDAEAKFFTEHLAPAARAIAAGVRGTTTHLFYVEAAEELKEFVDSESRRLV